MKVRLIVCLGVKRVIVILDEISKIILSNDVISVVCLVLVSSIWISNRRKRKKSNSKTSTVLWELEWRCRFFC